MPRLPFNETWWINRNEKIIALVSRKKKTHLITSTQSLHTGQWAPNIMTEMTFSPSFLFFFFLQSTIMPHTTDLHVLNYTFSVWQTWALPHNEKELFIACCALIICRAQQVQKEWRSSTPKLVLSTSCCLGQTSIIHAHSCATSNPSLPQSINWINKSLLQYAKWQVLVFLTEINITHRIHGYISVFGEFNMHI